LSDELVAVDTFFGWTIQGNNGEYSDSLEYSLLSTYNEEDFDVTKFWNLESVGISNPIEQISNESVSTINKLNGRYSVSLPWSMKTLQCQD